MSKNLMEFEDRLRQTAQEGGLTVISERENPPATTLLLPSGRRHIVDFFIPELALWIEHS